MYPAMLRRVSGCPEEDLLALAADWGYGAHLLEGEANMRPATAADLPEGDDADCTYVLR